MRNRILLYGAAVTALAIGVFSSAHAASFPDPPKTASAGGTASIVLAGGCFWGMQGIFEHMKGVTNTVVGYAGGKKETIADGVAHHDDATAGKPDENRREETILWEDV